MIDNFRPWQYQDYVKENWKIVDQNNSIKFKKHINFTKKLKINATFTTFQWVDFLRLLVCLTRHLILPIYTEKNSVAISGGSFFRLTGL